MDKKRLRVIGRLCSLAKEVGEHFEWYYTVDCLCVDFQSAHFHFDEKVIQFIEEAVREKIAREGGSK